MKITNCIIDDYNEKNEPLVKIEFSLSGDNVDVDIIDELLQISNAKILKKGELLKERKNQLLQIVGKFQQNLLELLI